MDKPVRGRAIHVCPLTHPGFMICMKPAVCCYPLRLMCLMCSSPYNLGRSHTLPFCPTSNPYSHFIPLTPHTFLTFLSPPPPPPPLHPVRAIAVARLPSLVVTRFSHCFSLPMRLTVKFLLFPRVSAESASQQCNETRLPSTACWDFTSLSLSCTAAAQTEQHCHLPWMQIQLTS